MTCRAQSWLSDVVLRLAAAADVYERGLDYAEDDLVDLTERSTRSVRATVHGSAAYAVELWDDAGTLGWSCTCPYAEDGRCCKHVVAAGLVALGERLRPDADAVPPGDGVSDADLRRWLLDLDHDALVDLTMHAAAASGELRRDLDLRVAAERGLAPDTGRYADALTAAFAVDDHVGWREMWDWTSGARQALAGVRDLLEAGFAEAAVGLAEHAWLRLEDAVGHVDDSGGETVMLADEVVDLHLAAVQAADADAQRAARWLLDAALSSELDTLRDRLVEYEAPLGPQGWAMLLEEAGERWERVEPRRPGDDDADRFGDRFRLHTIMEALAGDDLDARLAVRSKSLAHPYDWVRAVALCAEAGRDELAVEWAERGVEALGDVDTRLPEALADAYVRTGRLSDALEIERRLYRNSPSVTRYRRLRAVAEPLGSWPTERDEAHRVAEEAVQREEARRPRGVSHPRWWTPPAALLVGLHLDDGDVDRAWAVAEERGASSDQWMTLARLRADAHPEDAITVHRRRLDRALEPAKDRAYAAVVEILQDLQPLYARAGRGDFAELVAGIRSGYKRRRNLLKRLDDADL